MSQVQLQVGITSVEVLMPGGEGAAVETATRVLGRESTVAAIDSQAYWQRRGWKPGEPESDVRTILEVLIRCSRRGGVTAEDLYGKRAILELGHCRGVLPDARWFSGPWCCGLHWCAVAHGV